MADPVNRPYRFPTLPGTLLRSAPGRRGTTDRIIRRVTGVTGLVLPYYASSCSRGQFLTFWGAPPEGSRGGRSGAAAVGGGAFERGGGGVWTGGWRGLGRVAGRRR